MKSTKEFWQAANSRAAKESDKDKVEQKRREPKVVTKQELEQLGDWNNLTRG